MEDNNKNNQNQFQMGINPERVLSRIYMYLCSLIFELYLFIHLIKTLKL